ncbi:MAG: bifunctional hydroxymethylpyrimidine kinase/phosphomethylpyrimidine kinase, partial [Gemmatimonadetes bacterium]|nr:bifunctional hydroxymethylpyrimidine kinase/phosphomethylpyrimidine kinase [Gemmatimonadota bacterium]
MDSPRPPPVALTIAGSDSGGGAGIQADLKTFHQWGVYGTSALTAVTAQNTLGVQEIHPVPPPIIAAQIRSVSEDLAPRAVKSGMLATAEIVSTVAAAIRRHRLDAYVLDPVMVATSGDTLLERDAVAAVRGELLPLAAIVTPNWPEASLLARVRMAEANLRGMARAARVLVEAGADIH